MSGLYSNGIADSRCRHSVLLILFICACYIYPSTSFAQDWQFRPTVALTGEYNDNIRLDNDGTQNTGQDGDETGGEVFAGVRILRQSPTGIARFNPSVRVSRYGTDADTDDYYFNTFFRHTGQKAEWSIEARYADEEVLSAEILDPDFEDPDIDSPIIDDSGLVTIENRRNRIVVGPSVDFELSPRTTIRFLGQYVDSDYESGAGSLADYTNLHIEGGLARTLNEKNTLRISLFGRRFDPDVEDSETDSYGAFATFERRISERNSGFVRLGYEESDISAPSGGQVTNRSEGSLIIGAGATRRFRASGLVLDVQHSVTPSGIAELIQRNMFRVRFVRDISERTRVTISARYQNTKSLSEDSAIADRDFGRVALQMERQMSRAWSFIGGYAYTSQEFSDISNAESSNALYLGVRYSPLTFL